MKFSDFQGERRESLRTPCNPRAAITRRDDQAEVASRRRNHRAADSAWPGPLAHAVLQRSRNSRTRFDKGAGVTPAGLSPSLSDFEPNFRFTPKPITASTTIRFGMFRRAARKTVRPSRPLRHHRQAIVVGLYPKEAIDHVRSDCDGRAPILAYRRPHVPDPCLNA